ncbi:thioesterase-like superfamily-domain-containing protein [Aspergillus terricola var. indicus]
MTEPSHSFVFEKAIAVTPIDANSYSAYLDPAWCIGKAHLLQITFQRRTFAGPAFLTVQEIKLGARVSTIHRTKPVVKVLAYITLAPPDTEESPRVRGAGPWTDLSPGPSSTLLPKTIEERAKQVVDQWAQFAPSGTPARWSNEAVVYLADIFPAALDRMGAMEATRLLTTDASENTSAGPAGKSGSAALNGRATTDQGLVRFWYPTVTMNIDLKTRLPSSGVEWLHSRVVTRMVRGSSADLEVLILDQDGELVATSTQVALVVDPARNVKGRLQLDSGKL